MVLYVSRRISFTSTFDFLNGGKEKGKGNFVVCLAIVEYIYIYIDIFT